MQTNNGFSWTYHLGLLLSRLMIANCLVLGIQHTLLAGSQVGDSNGSNTGGSTSTDSLGITLVDPLPGPAGNDLITGQPVPLKMKVKYTLASNDHARLAIFAEEFPSTAGGCKGPVHQTNGGRNIQIDRGTGNQSITVVWLGNGPRYLKGYIAIGANLLTADGSQVISLFPFTTACYSFFPPGGQRID